MLRPLEEPLHTGYARRGGGGVDEAGGRLRRPGTAPAHSCTSPSIVLIVPVQCAPPGRGDASVPPPHRSTPAPTRWAGALQKNLPLRDLARPSTKDIGAGLPCPPPMMKMNDQSRSCHAERSEASLAMGSQMLRCAQHDKRPAIITDPG